MSSICTSNVTSGFIDLATFDEIEKYMYGGPDATAYFVRETRKSTWFTQVPVVLSRASGSPQFNQEWSVSISRAGDYLLQSWLRLQLPAVQLASSVTSGTYIRWTRNFMHNIVRECAITFNDLVAARFDSYHLDFWAAFTVPASKQNGYNNMIGNVPELINPVGQGGTLGLAVTGQTSNGTTLNLPLPFFYARDSGVALPTAALPYNEMRINFSFRDWSDLLIRSTGSGVSTTNGQALASELVNGAPSISQCQVWSNYAIVSNDERKRMACAPRDILIEQVQTAPLQSFTPATSTQQSFDIRFSHAIKVLFFAVKNNSCKSEWSNYTTVSPTIASGVISFAPAGTTDPILQTSLIYENTNRLQQMGSDYFSLVNPWYNAPTIPSVTGYHAYSYSLDFYCLDPLGSTNYGKLTNVSIVPEASADAVANNSGSYTTYNKGQSYQFIVTAVNNNIIRISGGKHLRVPPTVGCYKSCDNTFIGKQCKLSPSVY
jgi:hypothetical protein